MTYITYSTCIRKIETIRFLLSVGDITYLHDNNIPTIRNHAHALHMDTHTHGDEM